MEANSHLQNKGMKFECERCGECCRALSLFKEGWPRQTDGVCHYLTGNLCSIYENRPDFCNHELAYKYVADYMTRDEFVEKSILFRDELKSKLVV